MTPKLVPYWVCDRTPSSGWMIFFSAALVLGETNLYVWMLGPRFQLRTSSPTSSQSQLAVTCFLPQSNSLNFILFYSENTEHCQDLRASLYQDLVSSSPLCDWANCTRRYTLNRSSHLYAALYMSTPTSEGILPHVSPLGPQWHVGKKVVIRY